MNHLKTISIRIFILVMTLVMVALPTMQASAALHKCRTDPIFYLSNGEVLKVVLEIGTDETGVRDVHYVLHIPAGIRVLRVVYTTGGIGESETYQVVQDSPRGNYTTETIVNTYENGIPVTVLSSLRSGQLMPASGYNGDILVITLTQNNRWLSTSTLVLKAPEK